MAIQLLILMFLLLIIPFIVGGLFANVEKGGGRLLFRWISGQFLLWAGFQLMSVPLILREDSFNSLVKLFWGYMGAMMLFAIAIGIQRLAKGEKMSLAEDRDSHREKSISNIVLWGIFWGFLLFQLIQAVRLTYADGDDAFYVAISTITQNADTMYQKLPYTGGATELDARHGLAPFPIWISFLARASGMHAVTVAKVVLPVALISMTYGIFYLIGVRLFPERGGQLPLFLIFTEILVLFGNYSIYTVENFMTARSRQGKAALGSIVIPFLLFLFLVLFHKFQEGERIPAQLYLLFGAAAVAGCLCSTLGALLVCMMTGVAGGLGAICYKRFRHLVSLAVCCVPCIGYALLYLFFD